MVTTCNVRLLKANLKQGKTFYKLILVMKILKKIWEMQGVVKVTLYMVEFMIIMFEFRIIMLFTMIKTGMKHVVTHGNSELIYC